MERNIQIFCKNTGEYMDIAGGETLLEIATRIKDKLKFKPICAHVNNKTEGLKYPIFMPKMIEFFDCTHPSGKRLYIRSLCMILIKAVHDLFPERRLRIEHSISKGYYCVFTDDSDISEESVANIKTRMNKIVAENIPFCSHNKLTSDVIEKFKSSGNKNNAELLQWSDNLYTTYHQLDDIIDVYYGELAPSTAYISVFDLKKYKNGMLLLPPDLTKQPVAPCEPIKQEKLFKAFTDNISFNKIVGVQDVLDLNKVATQEGNEMRMLINVAETLHEKAIGKIADQIAERFHEGGAKVVLIAGPSSSGKTTTTKRLSVQLLANLIRPQMISLDDYFVNRENTPRDETGDYDYESLYALDLEQLNKDITDLIAGKEVALPTYDFTSGKRIYKGNTLKLTENSVLLMEGIHGLNPELTKAIPDKQKFKVYVSALTTLSLDDHNWVPTTDNRLLRRIVRDYKYRGASALDTISRWQSVRRGEEKWIFPFQENADAMFNSSLIFELGIMKDFAEPILRQVPHNVPEYAEAYRLLRFLSYFKAIKAEQVPSNSLLREFLGGSTFTY